MPKDPPVAIGFGLIDSRCLGVLGHCPSPPVRTCDVLGFGN